MKILIGVHHFPPNYKGGAEWSAFSTAKELLLRGHEIQVIAVEKIDDQKMGGELWWKDELYEGIKVRRLYFDLSSAPDVFRWEHDNLWIGEAFREAFRQFQPDIFHLFSGYLLTGRPLLESKKSVIPTVVTLTDFWFLCPRINMLKSDGEISELPINPASCARCIAEESRRYRIPAKVLPGVMNLYWDRKTKKAAKIEKRLEFLSQALNTAAVIVSPSNFLRSMYIESGILPEKIIFSRQGRDFDWLNEADLKKNKSSSVRLGYMGQIAPHKGVHLIFEAMQMLKDLSVELFVYGNCNQFPAYTSMLEKMAGKDLKITFAGVFEGSSQLTGIMKNLDLIIVPSVCYENSPNVILESFAYQTPVIAANRGGMAELVQDNENGLLFEAGNSMDLQDKIRRVVENPGLLQKLKTGIPPVKTVATEMDELEEIYGSLISRKQ